MSSKPDTAMEENRLVEIPVEDWSKLRDLYVDRKLESNSFWLIQNFINWLNKDPSLKNSLKFYSLNGDWSDGTFIIQDPGRYTSINTLTSSQDRLLTALHCLDKKQAIFWGTPIRIKPTIDRFAKELGIEKQAEFETFLFSYIEIEKALEFNTDPPPGIKLSPLAMEHVNTINDAWPYKHPGSDLMIGRLIHLNVNIGAFDEKGNLVAWCLLYPYTALGMLQVQESHKRQGLGGLLVRVMSKMNAKQGVVTFTGVSEENTPSRSLFKSLGFQVIDKIFRFHKPEIK